MKDIKIKINTKTRMVTLSKSTIGNDGENLQNNFVFEFDDDFVNGQARLEYVIDDEKKYVFLDRKDETYTTPVKSFLTKEGTIDMQLVILEGTDEENVPIFKSNMFYVYCNHSINAEVEEPENITSWLDMANAKINQVDNLDISIKNSVVTITKKDGTTESENVKGDSYEITEEDYNKIESNVKSDIQPILENIENVSKQAEVIARGRATGYPFDTVEELDTWLLVEENVAKLVIGDNFYIRDLGVPDYWWDGTSKQVLETEKPDLTEYAKKEQFVTLTQEEYDALTEKSANTYYFIPEGE